MHEVCTEDSIQGRTYSKPLLLLVSNYFLCLFSLFLCFFPLFLNLSFIDIRYKVTIIVCIHYSTDNSIDVEVIK